MGAFHAGIFTGRGTIFIGHLGEKTMWVPLLNLIHRRRTRAVLRRHGPRRGRRPGRTREAELPAGGARPVSYRSSVSTRCEPYGMTASGSSSTGPWRDFRDITLIVPPLASPPDCRPIDSVTYEIFGPCPRETNDTDRVERAR